MAQQVLEDDCWLSRVQPYISLYNVFVVPDIKPLKH